MLSNTFIIPIHDFNPTIKKFLTRCLNSLLKLENTNECRVCFVGPTSVLTQAETVYKKVGVDLPLTKIENDDTDVFVQINKAAFQCLTPFFTVLEFDDAVTKHWLVAAEEWVKQVPNQTVYLPIVEICDVDGKRQFFNNELGWSPTFVHENLGSLSNETLTAFKGFSVHGALISTEDFISVHSLKPSLRIAAWYEFLLRLCYKEKGIFVVPRIGYQHTVGREDSYDEVSGITLTDGEAKWLIKTAEQEYFFDEDRHLKYLDELNNETKNDSES